MTTEELVAPAPDFRYVALRDPSVRGVGAWIGGSAAVLALAHSAAGVVGGRIAWAVGALGVGVLALGSALVQGRGGGAGPSAAFALVPWGVLVEPGDGSRALFWSSVRDVEVTMHHARDGGVATTVSSRVTVVTERERWTGHAPGDVSLERLQAHHEAYAQEQARALALDLGGERAVDPLEPGCESVNEAARAWLDGADGARSFGLPAASYRLGAARVATPELLDALRTVLRGRGPFQHDPRALAVAIALQVSARELVPELVALVQSPHPQLAAFAKVAALRLGADASRAGALDEVAPFLRPEDESYLRDLARC